MKPFTLSDADIDLGDRIATHRISRARRGRFKDTQRVPGKQMNGNAAHYHGAWAEIAVARYLNVELPADESYRFHDQPDLDPDIEVRWAGDGRLIIRDHDRLDSRFVLVTGEPPTLTLCGWINGNELLWSWRTDPGRHGPAWFVPAGALHPMSELTA